VTEGQGFGAQKGHTELYRGAEYVVDFLPKVKARGRARDSLADASSRHSPQAAQTAASADGKIFVSTIEGALRIRTARRGSDAI
jgi:nitrogen regulatory protein P-II 1